MRFLHLLLISVSLAFTPISARPATDSVFICVSGTAYAYHRTEDCHGLKKCTHTIKKITEEEATKEYKRKPCGYCNK